MSIKFLLLGGGFRKGGGGGSANFIYIYIYMPVGPFAAAILTFLALIRCCFGVKGYVRMACPVFRPQHFGSRIKSCLFKSRVIEPV